MNSSLSSIVIAIIWRECYPSQRCIRRSRSYPTQRKDCRQFRSSIHLIRTYVVSWKSSQLSLYSFIQRIRHCSRKLSAPKRQQAESKKGRSLNRYAWINLTASSSQWTRKRAVPAAKIRWENLTSTLAQITHKPAEQRLPTTERVWEGSGERHRQQSQLELSKKRNISIFSILHAQQMTRFGCPKFLW